jgi:hypothetical protein
MSELIQGNSSASYDMDDNGHSLKVSRINKTEITPSKDRNQRETVIRVEPGEIQVKRMNRNSTLKKEE